MSSISRRTANAAVFPEDVPPPRSLLRKGGAAFPHFVAVQALAVWRSAAASSSLLRASMLYAAHRDRRDWCFCRSA
jgi:hypothetical protein